MYNNNSGKPIFELSVLGTNGKDTTAGSGDNLI